MSGIGFLDRLRQPQYTGENRCTPCTVVNAGIAVVAALGVGAAVTPAGPEVAVLLAGGALSAFAGVIYLRGYLVPGTPWLTERYFPDWLLRRFEHGDGPVDTRAADEDTAAGAEAAPEVDVEGILLEAGAVTECDDVDDLCLADGFRTAWRDAVEQVRSAEESRAEIARVLDADPDRLSVEEYEEAFLARLDGRRVGLWESRAAFLADVAAANVLRERYEGWASLDGSSRVQVLSGLRLFIERCPSCDGPVTIDQSVVESCCRSLDVLAVTCQDCGARLFEIEEP
ncbi:hypothetical protein [Halobellus ruber]|uniref:Uncharacterized protein n=1 Tax=Halobellus ruber TaxID=2761102 RepID=A0A7J9SJW8_9EURY|nr:hypothetical protein [Halobellus ruber]MBB6645311.1 hypothetical protein [Halobellus ruber]